MAGFSDYTEKKILDLLFKSTAFTPPTVLYVSLHSADPNDVSASELSGGSYGRAPLNPDPNNTTHTNWNAVDQSSAAAKMSNKLEIPFPQATANWNSGNPINYWGVYDASSGGNLLLAGTITSGVTVLNTQTLKFSGGSPGALTFTVD